MAEKCNGGTSAPATPSPSYHHGIGNLCDRTSAEKEFIRGRYEEDVVDVAAKLCDVNIELMAHIELLRARILELENENERLYRLVRKQEMREETTLPMSEGDETLIRVLQAEIADLERQVYLAKAARKSAEATSEALDTKAKMLSELLKKQILT